MFKDVEDKREAFVAADMMLSVRPVLMGYGPVSAVSASKPIGGRPASSKP
jgi:hypothetical protein